VSETEKLACAFASGPPLPIADIKRALASSASNDLGAQVDLETQNQLRAFASSDAAEGMAAFFERRTPAFRGE
jgi:enoyl-CoA hydratase/carnithine racemase